MDEAKNLKFENKVHALKSPKRTLSSLLSSIKFDPAFSRKRRPSLSSNPTMEDLIQAIRGYVKQDRYLASAISRLMPELTDEDVQKIEARLLEYIAKGIDDGYSLALIKDAGSERVELKILTLAQVEDPE